MNFVPPREPRRVAPRAQCRNCGAPGQECGAACAYCSVVVEVAVVEVKKPPAEAPKALCPPRWVQE